MAICAIAGVGTIEEGAADVAALEFKPIIKVGKIIATKRMGNQFDFEVCIVLCSSGIDYSTDIFFWRVHGDHATGSKNKSFLTRLRHRIINLSLHIVG